MSVAEPTANEVWEWLAECKKCGNAHDYRPVTCKCGRPMHGHQMTWESRVDGHAYESRMSAWQLGEFRLAWEHYLARAAAPDAQVEKENEEQT